MMTKEEIAKLKENLHKIEDYVRKNYIPRLRKCESLSVQFGELKLYPCSWTREYEHSFGFSHDGDIWLRTGGLGEHFGDNPIYGYNIYTSPFHAEDLMLQWPHVKRLIEEEFQKRESKRAALDAFEV